MILDEIVESVKERYKKIKEETPLDKLIEKIDFHEKKEYRFYDLLKEKKFIFICE
jgi:indole-3-glycerol phosphate synthase